MFISGTSFNMCEVVGVSCISRSRLVYFSRLRKNTTDANDSVVHAKDQKEISVSRVIID